SSPTAAGTYNSVKATPTTGTCNGMQISCGGTLTVSLPSFTCGSVAQSITTTQIPNKPAVTCGGTTVTAANITWSPNINNVLAAGSHTVKATASCGLTDQTATCSGTITVTAPSSSSVAPSSSSLAPSSSSLAPSSSSLAPSSSSLAPSSSSLAPSSSSLAPSSSSLAPSSSSAAQPISITSTETSIPAGTHSITCSGGGQLVCRTLDGTKKTFTINDAECTAFEQMGWGSCGSGSCKASTSTIVTPASISCAGMW
ncbi:MAG: hypothetical protein FWC26_09480, partial [Fibromonadales bacterium]|nr:hypothetical protein [Fibromonadales bacterium]